MFVRKQTYPIRENKDNNLMKGISQTGSKFSQFMIIPELFSSWVGNVEPIYKVD